MPTENWKSITIKEFKGKYIISESGRVKRKGRYAKINGHWIPEVFIQPSTHTKKYLRINLSKDGISKSYYIHRLVAMFFVANPDNKPHINHLDGNKLNNHFSNLEWCTPQENNEHGYRTGLLRKGRKPPVYKYMKKGNPPRFKKVIDINTGEVLTTKELASRLSIRIRYITRMLREERKPNKSQYRYA